MSNDSRRGRQPLDVKKKSGLSPTFLFGAVAVETVAFQHFKGFTCFGVLRLHTVEQQSEVTGA